MSGAPENTRAWASVNLVILIGMGAINVFLPLFIVPKFEQIFQDALPGQPLPEFTRFVIAARIPLALISVVWPVAGIIAVWRRQRAAIWIVSLGLVFFFAMIQVTVVALIMPMGGHGGGMSDVLTTSPAPNP